MRAMGDFRFIWLLPDREAEITLESCTNATLFRVSVSKARNHTKECDKEQRGGDHHHTEIYQI